MVYAVLGLYTLSWCWYRFPEIGTGTVDWAKLSRFYLKTETESQSSKCCVFKYKEEGVLNEDRAMDNVQKHNISTNVPSS
jgi:hypothetical protein